MTTTNIYDMAQTWNEGSTVFTAIKMNVTDTASDADSLLLDLQVGGTSQFSVGKDRLTQIAGELRVFRPDIPVRYFGLRVNEGASNSGWMQAGNNRIMEVRSFGESDERSYVRIAGYIDIGSIFGEKAQLHGEGNSILAQRNGLNSQEFRLYNTYTDASNYERGGLKWDGDILKLFTEHSGGTLRSVGIFSGPASIELLAGRVRINSEAGRCDFFPSGSITGGGGEFQYSGNVKFDVLPTTDPTVAGRLWNDAGTVKISAG